MSVPVTFYWPKLSPDLTGREKGNTMSRGKKKENQVGVSTRYFYKRFKDYSRLCTFSFF